MLDFLNEIELDWLAVALALVFSAIMLGIVWFNPIWKESTAFPIGIL